MGTYTFALLEVSDEAFEEICGKLMDADYGHAVLSDDDKVVLNMHGLALISEGKPAEAEPTRQELIEALTDATSHLLAAASAYQVHASRSNTLPGRARADPFYTTRTQDYLKAAERGRTLLLKVRNEKG